MLQDLRLHAYAGPQDVEKLGLRDQPARAFDQVIQHREGFGSQRQLPVRSLGGSPAQTLLDPVQAIPFIRSIIPMKPEMVAGLIRLEGGEDIPARGYVGERLRIHRCRLRSMTDAC